MNDWRPNNKKRYSANPFRNLREGRQKTLSIPIFVYSHIYGVEFMTEKERCEYLLKLDGMKTKSERDAFRAQHRKAIDERRKKIGG